MEQAKTRQSKGERKQETGTRASWRASGRQLKRERGRYETGGEHWCPHAPSTAPDGTFVRMRVHVCRWGVVVVWHPETMTPLHTAATICAPTALAAGVFPAAAGTSAESARLQQALRGVARQCRPRPDGHRPGASTPKPSTRCTRPPRGAAQGLLLHS